MSKFEDKGIWLHIFKRDWIEPSVLEQTFDMNMDGLLYEDDLNERTRIQTYCETETTLRSENWVYGLDYATCTECKDAYALEVLGELP
jgi:hypothetical protein